MKTHHPDLSSILRISFMSFYFEIHTGISERISGTMVNRFRGQTETYLFETLVSSLSVKGLAAMG